MKYIEEMKQQIDGKMETIRASIKHKHPEYIGGFLEERLNILQQKRSGGIKRKA